MIPESATIDGNVYAPIVDHRHAIPISRINPHFVIVPTGIGSHFGQRVATIQRPGKRGGEEIHFVLIVRRNLGARVVMRAPANVAVVIHHLPVLAAII